MEALIEELLAKFGNTAGELECQVLLAMGPAPGTLSRGPVEGTYKVVTAAQTPGGKSGFITLYLTPEAIMGIQMIEANLVHRPVSKFPVPTLV